DAWHDQMLNPGEHLNRAIDSKLAAAELVILLVSPDFINSDYCTEKEMRRAFARAKDGRCKVVPVILRSSLWRDIRIDDEGGTLGELVALPHDGKPVASSPHGQESALDSVVAGIRRLIKDKTASVALPGKRHESLPPVKRRRATQVKAFKATERDVWLADAIWRVFLGTWDLPPHAERAPIGQEENQRFFDLVTKEFRQKAFDGQLLIWAKRNNSDLWEIVPTEYWKNHRIAYLNVVREDPTKLSVEQVGSLKPSHEWREFMTARSTIDAVWPAKRKRK